MGGAWGETLGTPASVIITAGADIAVKPAAQGLGQG